MTIAVVAHTQVTGLNGGTTSPDVNTTGATLIVIHNARYGPGGAISVSDNKGNFYSPLTEQDDGAVSKARLWYCENPTVGANHNFTCSGSVTANASDIIAFSGTLTSGALDTGSDKGSSGNTGTSGSGGSFTPSAANSVVVSGWSANSGSSGPSCSGFTVSDSADYSGGNNVSGGLAYQIQTTATNVNPTWSWSGSTNWCVTEATFLAAGASPTITISEAVQKTKQTVPLDTAQTYHTVTFSGTYSGTAPTNVAVQLTNESGGGVIVSWTTLTGTSIGGGTWSGTLQVSGVATYLLAQARETNNTAVTSSLTTKSFNVGTVPLLIGQSQIAHFWQQSAQLTDVTTTNGSPTVSSATFGANFDTNRAAGYSFSGTNIPGGTTVVSNSGNNLVLSANATGSGSNLTCNLGLTPPSATAGTTRYQGVAFYPTTDGPHASEIDFSNTVANAEGATTLANELSAGISGGVALLEAAVGSTGSAYWMSPSGAGYLSAAALVAGIGSDFDWVNWDNGGTDALSMTQAVSNATNNGSGLIRLTVADTSLYSTGNSAVVSGVGGVTAANGTWTITVINATTIDLQGSTFSGSYTTGGSVLSNDSTIVTANTTNIEAWCHGYRAGAGFGVTIIGTDINSTIIDSSTDAVRQQQLAYIDANASGKVFFAGHDTDLQRQDEFHLTPPARVRMAKRKTQSYLRWRGLSSSGYGPKIASAAWDGNVTVTITVTHEAGTALRSKGLSSSGSSLTGFKVYGNGSLATISGTAFSQPNQIVLTLSTMPTGPVTLSYLAGSNPTVTNVVYDDMAPLSDSDGLPLQPSRGTGGLITATAASSGARRLTLLGVG